MLEVRLANDPRAAVRGPMRVRWRITIESQNAKAAARQLAHRGTSHRAEASDDDVPALGHGSALKPDAQPDQRVRLVDHDLLEADIEGQAVRHAERHAAAQGKARPALILLSLDSAADIELRLTPEESRLDKGGDGESPT